MSLRPDARLSVAERRFLSGLRCRAWIAQLLKSRDGCGRLDPRRSPTWSGGMRDRAEPDRGSDLATDRAYEPTGTPQDAPHASKSWKTETFRQAQRALRAQTARRD